MSELEKAEEPTNRLSVNSRHSAQHDYERRVSNVVDILDGAEVNASGHQDELARQYGIWSLCGLALTIDNAWVALGGSIIVASCEYSKIKIRPFLENVTYLPTDNGGPPGILYELLTAIFYYSFIGASIAEVTNNPHSFQSITTC
jgi:choline transport protein